MNGIWPLSCRLLQTFDEGSEMTERDSTSPCTSISIQYIVDRTSALPYRCLQPFTNIGISGNYLSVPSLTTAGAVLHCLLLLLFLLLIVLLLLLFLSSSSCVC